MHAVPTGTPGRWWHPRGCPALAKPQSRDKPPASPRTGAGTSHHSSDFGAKQQRCSRPHFSSCRTRNHSPQSGQSQLRPSSTDLQCAQIKPPHRGTLLPSHVFSLSLFQLRFLKNNPIEVTKNITQVLIKKAKLTMEEKTITDFARRTIKISPPITTVLLSHV